MRKFSMMNIMVDETSVQEKVYQISQYPDISRKLQKKYSELSGIDPRYIDLRTTIRGLMCQGLL